MNGKSFVRPSASLFRFTTFLGLAGGFFIAYNRSSQRFWGWSENQPELRKYKEDIKQNLLKGEPPHGRSSLSPWLQDIANRNSANSQLGLNIVPWFNFVNHPYHGNDSLVEEVRAEINKQ